MAGRTLQFLVQIDIHEGHRMPNPDRLVPALARVINHATEVDIEGAEILDSRIGQVSVHVVRPGQVI